jgi:Ca2+/Na+ antiporter
MGIVISLIVVLICCVIIWRASDAFEESSELIGENLSDGVRGATINAIGSSMPELFTTVFFLLVLKDTESFSGGLGTTAGSAIFNGMIIPAVVILAVIGAGVVKSIQVSKKVLIRDGISLLVAEAVLIFLIGGTTLKWYHGLILMLLYVAYIVIMFSTMSAPAQDEVEDEVEDQDEDEKSSSRFMALLTLDIQYALYKDEELTKGRAWVQLIISMMVIGAACLLLVVACQWMGADTFTVPLLGEFSGFGIPIIFVSVVIASAATSVPDTILSIRDAKAGNYDDAVSNAIGSNIFDVCFALGLPLFIYTLVYGDINMDADIVVYSSELRILLFILTFIAVMIYLFGKSMGKLKAYLLLMVYALFTLYIVGRAMDWEFAKTISDYLNSMYSAING